MDTGSHKQTKNNKRVEASQANHLLNFKYAEKPKEKRRPKYSQIVPFSKEKFLQANYRFVVADSGDYSANLRDPDLLVDWDKVEEVHLSTHTPYNCPICLEPPVAAKVSKCGHVFCWACIIRHLSFANGITGKCPMCFAFVSLKDLRSVVTTQVTKYKEGDLIKFVLMKRAKDSMVALPKSKWRPRTDSVPSSSDPNTRFCRLTITTNNSDILLREFDELLLAAKEAQSCQDESLPFIIEAQEHLQERIDKDRGQNASIKQPKVSVSNKPAKKEPEAFTATVIPKGKEEEPKQSQDSEPVERWDPFDDYDYEKLESKSFADEIDQAIETNKESKSMLTESLNGHSNHASNGNAKDLDKVRSTSDLDQTESSRIKVNDIIDDGFSYVYQAEDGQQVYLHALDFKILMNFYGSVENLPATVEGRILELEDFTQTEATRKRYKALSHVPMTCNFTFVEIDLRRSVPREAFKPFLDELQRRSRRRASIKRKDKLEREKEQEPMIRRQTIDLNEDFPAPVPVQDEFSEEFERALKLSALEPEPLPEVPEVLSESPRGAWATPILKEENKAKDQDLIPPSSSPSYLSVLKEPKVFTPPPNTPVKKSKSKRKGTEYIVFSNATNIRYK